MKKAKKILALLLCAVLLVGASVAGTLAYLTDEKQVNNTFTVGNVAIKLDEAIVDPETGEVKIDPETGKATDERTEDGNEELLMVPGRSIVKDPTVTVLKGSENCYVRVKVTVDLPNWTDDAAKLAEWMTDEQDFADAFRNWAGNFAGSYLISNNLDGFNKENWNVSGPDITHNDATAKTIEYVLTYKNDSDNIVEKNANGDTELPAIFDKVMVPKALTNDQLALLEGMTIHVEAHAIQAESFTDSIEAWEAFDNPNA